ncbi:MAG: hypothetical protein MJ252_07435, partial [archaeon]|nr:hypothetical protein [archaeon]
MYFCVFKISFDSNVAPEVRKLSSILLKNILNKNWQISENELQKIFSCLIESIKIYYNTNEYNIKHYISNLIGLIISKQIENDSYTSFINLLLNNIKTTLSQGEGNKSKEVNTELEMILNILLKILIKSDDRLISNHNDYGYNIISHMILILESKTYFAKNKEKALLILIQVINKITFADGSDDLILENVLIKDNLFETLINTLLKILSYNYNFTSLSDLRKYSLKLFNIIISDMPIFSNKINLPQKIFVNTMQCLKENLFYYLMNTLQMNVNLNTNEIEESENNLYNYERGYESENDEEIYGLKGFLIELMDLIKNIICFIIENNKGKVLLDNINDLFQLSLICKIYSFMNTSINNRNDIESLKQLFEEEYEISEEQSMLSDVTFMPQIEEEEIKESLSIRKQSLKILNEIFNFVLLADDKQNFKIFETFLKCIIDELLNGFQMNKDGNNFYSFFSDSKYEKILQNQKFYFLLNETNLYLLGALSNNIDTAIEYNSISKSDMNTLIELLLGLLN